MDLAIEDVSLLYEAKVWEWAVAGARPASGAQAVPPRLGDASPCFLSKGRGGAQP
jgi:hypothetical protein